MDPNYRIGIVLNLTPAYPRSQHPEDGKLRVLPSSSQIFFRSICSWSLSWKISGDPTGARSLTRDYDPFELRLIEENTVDYLGVNYTTTPCGGSSLCSKSSISPTLEQFYEPMSCPGRKINPHRGWEIYEQGLYDMPKNIKGKTMAISSGSWPKTDGSWRRGKFLRWSIQDDYGLTLSKTIFGSPPGYSRWCQL